MTILSYKTIFGPTFSAILENLLETFFAMSQKLRFWQKMAIFYLIWPTADICQRDLCHRAFLDIIPRNMRLKFFN